MLLPSLQKGKRKVLSTTSATVMPVPKKRHDTNSLAKYNIPDIIAAALKALPAATYTHSNPPTILLATNPPSQLTTPKDEQQYQELGESLCY